MRPTTFKYTFPITKAETRADGNYIIGYASGPEIDTEGERMAPEAIQRFSDQINATDETMRLTYRDAHAPDGVLRDLGEITKAWIDDKFHLGIEVKVDMANPAGKFLFEQVNKGKQYGMSVAGRVLDYADEFVSTVGKTVRTYKNVVLDEISNTTRPAWYPSFGTVLAKSIKDASPDASTGVNVDEDELPGTEVEDATTKSLSDDLDIANAPVVDLTGEADSDNPGEVDEEVGKSSSAASDASQAAYIEASLLSLLGGEAGDPEDESPLRVALAAIQQFIAQEAAEIGTPEDQASEYSSWSVSDQALASDLAKAGRKLSGATSAKLLELYNEMNATLTDLGVIETEEEISSEKSASDATEDTTVKTESAPATAEYVLKSEHDALTDALKKANERIAVLEARPSTELPHSITDATRKSEDDFVAAMAKASPSDRIRLAMAARTGGK